MKPLLVAGGDSDPQLLHLLQQALQRGLPVHVMLSGAGGLPKFHWDIKTNQLVDGDISVDPCAAFIRQDVFAFLRTHDPMDQMTARDWYVAVAGWLASHPEVRVFNRPFLSHGPVNKPYILHLALSLGFEIADTFITNHGTWVEEMSATHEWISKPIAGGDYCKELVKPDGREALAYPKIVQRKLIQPELRVFRVGNTWHGFSMVSDVLDYRVSPQTKVIAADIPDDIREKMQALTDHLQLDYAAADFKTEASTGKLQFLEINTGAMFAAFNKASDGALCNAMLDWLYQ